MMIETGTRQSVSLQPARTLCGGTRFVVSQSQLVRTVRRKALKMTDRIFISNLELLSRIGITAEERDQPQRLTISLGLEPRRDFSALEDSIGNAVDYATVCEKVRALASASQRNLIETLAVEIAQALLVEFPLDAVEIELRKYILPETDYVAVKIRREAAR